MTLKKEMGFQAPDDARGIILTDIQRDWLATVVGYTFMNAVCSSLKLGHSSTKTTAREYIHLPETWHQADNKNWYKLMIRDILAEEKDFRVKWAAPLWEWSCWLTNQISEMYGVSEIYEEEEEE